MSVVEFIMENGRMELEMEREHLHLVMETNMKVNSRKDGEVVKEHIPFQMEE